MQATEVIKLILGKGEPLIGRLLLIDALDMKFRELKLRKNPDCPVCGTHPTIKQLIDYNEFCGIRGEEKPVETSDYRHPGGRTEETAWMQAKTCSCWTCVNPTNIRSAISADTSFRWAICPSA